MTRRAHHSACLACVFVGQTIWAVPPAIAEDSSSARTLFANPTRAYSTAPLWVWNDDLTPEQIVQTLRDLAGQNVKQAFVHPRPGLMTPYLSEPWMRLWEAALAEAERLDMNIWIYDENSYPSGFAGGLVPEALPDSRGRGLDFREEKRPPVWTDDTLAVFRLTADAHEDVSQKVRAGEAMPEARYLVASFVHAKARGWYGGKWYVDLLRPGVTEKFLSITLDAYRHRLGKHFGKRLPGVFTDEPNIKPTGGLPWTQDLPQIFERRWGYSLIEHLPSLARPLGDFKRVRHNYLQLLNELFVERWAKPYYEYCEKHNLEMTGHYWEHDWPFCLRVPDNMAMYAWQQRPAIDTLMNQYREDVHAQFGNVRAVRELRSVANQLGKRRTLCEAYGAAGWDLRLEDIKRIGDWLYVLGVNHLDDILSFITIRGARKRDHPQSLSYHAPYWEAYHVAATYFTRLSVAMSHGEQVNRILVIEPTTTAWMHNTHGKKSDPQLQRIGNAFQQLVVDLEKAQVEFDIGSEDILARHGSTHGSKLVVGKREYASVVLAPLTENLNATTMDLLDTYLAAGGDVLCCGPPPARIDGKASDRGGKAAESPTWNETSNHRPVGAADLPSILKTHMASDPGALVVTPDPGDHGILFHHTRRFDDGRLLFLVNTRIDAPSSGRFSCPNGSVERWDPETGAIAPYSLPADARLGSLRMSVPFRLPPCGSLLLFVSNEGKGGLAAVPGETVVVVPSSGPVEIRRTEPNVLTLDYVDVTAKGETRKNLYCVEAGKFAFRKNGLESNPWERAVQFRDELIARKFPADSGFEATYRFTIRDRVPNALSVVIERGDLYTITCNGRRLSAATNVWWLDKSFTRIDIASAARVGENTVTIKAAPMTMFHELEAAYILGDFALEPAAQSFAITPKRQLQLGVWNEQGLPLYGHGVSYSQRFKVDRPNGRYFVALPDWYGSVAKVVVNDTPAGYIWHPPWEHDVTDRIKPGVNTIEVVVIGTLKNTLGPHHGNPALGLAWPSAWDKAPQHGPPPGKDYATVGYGLFEAFVLRHLTQ